MKTPREYVVESLQEIGDTCAVMDTQIDDGEPLDNITAGCIEVQNRLNIIMEILSIVPVYHLYPRSRIS